MDAQFSSWGGKRNSIGQVFEKKPEVAAVFTSRDTSLPGAIPGCAHVRYVYCKAWCCARQIINFEAA